MKGSEPEQPSIPPKMCTESLGYTTAVMYLYSLSNKIRRSSFHTPPKGTVLRAVEVQYKRFK